MYVALVWFACDTFGMLVPLKLLHDAAHLFTVLIRHHSAVSRLNIFKHNNFRPTRHAPFEGFFCKKQAPSIARLYYILECVQLPNSECKEQGHFQPDLNSSNVPFDWSDRSALARTRESMQSQPPLWPFTSFYSLVLSYTLLHGTSEGMVSQKSSLASLPTRWLTESHAKIGVLHVP